MRLTSRERSVRPTGIRQDEQDAHDDMLGRLITSIMFILSKQKPVRIRRFRRTKTCASNVSLPKQWVDSDRSVTVIAKAVAQAMPSRVEDRANSNNAALAYDQRSRCIEGSVRLNLAGE